MIKCFSIISAGLTGIVLLATAALAETTPVAASAAPVLPPTQDLESAGVPVDWKAGDGGQVAVTTERYKSGRQSLLWDWKKAGSTLTFQNAEAFLDLKDGKTSPRDKMNCFGVWVYNEKPTATPMRAEFLHGLEVVSSFWFWMDYKGWRLLGASYDDIKCKPDQVVDGIRFHAPDGVSSGHLYLDYARFNFKRAGSSYLPSNYQVPWIGNPEGLRHPEAIALSGTDLCQNRPWLPVRKKAEEITMQEHQDLENLAKRFLPPLIRPGKGLKPEELEGLRQTMAEYKIERRNGKLTGRPVDSGSVLQPADAVDLWDYLRFCSKVQQAYAQASHPEQTAELKKMFADLSAHLLDQGFAEGGPMIRQWSNYPGDKQCTDAFLNMRDVLAEAGLVREIALASAYLLGCQDTGVSNYLNEKPFSSMDGFGLWAVRLMPCLLMLPDETARLQYVRAAQYYFSHALLNPRTIDADGCAYHHGIFHFAYARYCMPPVFSIVEQLDGTEFCISPEAHERLRKYVRTISFLQVNGELPYNVVARAGAPTPTLGGMARLAKTLALMGTPDRKQKLDTEMAGLCLAQLNDIGADPAKTQGEEPTKSWLTQGIRPLARTGHLTLNGATVAAHRRGDWLVSIGGMSKLRVGVEVYGWTQTNNYGRYSRNGSICVVSNGNPPSLGASGWAEEGWDWCHFPGTTALEKPPHEMFDGYRHYGGKTPVAGGTDLDGDGIFGMDNVRTSNVPKPPAVDGDGELNFKKSVFCFDNRVTVITTGIASKAARPTVTTLFQNTFLPSGETVLVDGESVGIFPSEHKIGGDKAHWLIDNKGTGYYIPAGHDPVRLVCRRQEWTYITEKYLIDPKNTPFAGRTVRDAYQFGKFKHKDILENEKYFRPSTGDFALAWFDHGLNPANASCSYTIIVRTTPETMKKMSDQLALSQSNGLSVNSDQLGKEPPYRILQKDAKAHILWDRDSNTTGYILFDSSWSPSPTTNYQLSTSNLLQTDTPCFVMLRRDGSKLRVSVANPDIKRTGPIRLKLQGSWKPGALPTEPLTVTAIGKDTQIEVQPDSYMPIRFELESIP